MIEIMREDTAGLERQRWCWLMLMGTGGGVSIVLDEWRRETRETLRHDWQQAGDGYKRRIADTQHTHGMQLDAGSVPVPDDVVAEAQAAAESSLRVVGPQSADTRH